MGSQSSLHFVLFPLMAQGHMIPLVDIGKLLAQRGMIVSIVTTPLNAARFESQIARANESGLQIQLIRIPFPCIENGLPEGCESFDKLPPVGLSFNFFTAISMLHEPAEKAFERLTPRPNCIISDMCVPFTIDIAKKYNIPRITFHAVCCFCLYGMYKVYESKVLDSAKSDTEYVEVPGLHHKIRVTRLQVPGPWDPRLTEIITSHAEADAASQGVLVNSSEELEGIYTQEFKKLRNGKVWYVGPVFLCNKGTADKAQRGGVVKSSSNDDNISKWLDSQKPSSVIYISLGSLFNLPAAQLKEIGLGLEKTNRPFIWQINTGNKTAAFEQWLSEDGFEERVKGRGLLLRGWAPQLLIFSHPSTGGFLTHSGWNSIQEALLAGLPMATWPLFGDNFMTEKLAVDVLQIAVRMGVDEPIINRDKENPTVQVRSDDVKEAVDRLMDDGDEGKERKKRIKELGDIARKAMEEGGSSHLDLTLFIEEIRKLQECGYDLYSKKE